ncbi:MAG: Wzz/FepE/Etk N-terminal domain-containing protein [Anaerolineae bacterium]|nr:Wzz/FepE/Etk N-terminal domain-containing protein [Anaerolineae bacterium]MDQ7034695.1 Wzz/FepE/Etk N-terminal domain-containing protein [Anaerolineae bacterium]
MNLIDYARIIIRRGWIAILLAVIAAGAAFLFSQTVTPEYRATQTILIVPSRSDLGLTEAVLRIINQRRTYLDSDLRAQSIIDRLQLDYHPAYLRGQTTLTANRDNLTIQIDVELPIDRKSLTDEQFNAEINMLGSIAIEWGNELITYQDDLNQQAQRVDRIQAQPQDNPRISQQSPKVGVNIIIGAIAGFFLGTVLIFVLEYLESNMIRRREDIERATNLKVLAVVPIE